MKHPKGEKPDSGAINHTFQCLDTKWTVLKKSKDQMHKKEWKGEVAPCCCILVQWWTFAKKTSFCLSVLISCIFGTSCHDLCQCLSSGNNNLHSLSPPFFRYCRIYLGEYTVAARLVLRHWEEKPFDTNTPRHWKEKHTQTCSEFFFVRLHCFSLLQHVIITFLFKNISVRDKESISKVLLPINDCYHMSTLHKLLHIQSLLLG